MKALIAASVIIFAAAANGQTPVPTTAPTTAPQTQQPQQTQPITTTRIIVVSLEDHKLALVENGAILKTYTVAIGKPSTPSPEGSFTIKRRVANPTYQHHGKIIPAGPGNPVGTRWMGLSKAGYGIHGTNEPHSIGKSASHGCIRMGKADLEEFYKLVSVGDTVEIIGLRNEETAALFQPEPKPTAAPAATVQASVETPAPANAEPLLTPSEPTPTAMLLTAGSR